MTKHHLAVACFLCARLLSTHVALADGVLVEPDARAAIVRNGTVRNMGVEGIWERSDGRLQTTAYSDAINTSIVTQAVSSSRAPYVLIVPYNDFTAIVDGFPADLSDIGALQLALSGDGVTANTDLIETTSASLPTATPTATITPPFTATVTPTDTSTPTPKLSPKARATPTTTPASVCFTEWDGDNVTDFSSADASAVREAIVSAPASSTVKVAGTCVGTAIFGDGSFVANITKHLTLEGGHNPADWTTDPDLAANPTTLDANGDGLVVRVDGAAVVVSNLILTGGNGENGGGLYNWGNVTVHNCRIEGNSVINGGGGLYNNGYMSVVDSSISGNAANQGGGIFNNFGDTLSLLNVTISNNSSDQGAAVYVRGAGGEADLSYVTALNNTTGGVLSGDVDLEATSTLNLTASVIVSDLGDSSACYGPSATVNDLGANHVGPNDCGFKEAGDPLLGALSDNGGGTLTHAVNETSLVLDQVSAGTADCGTAVTTDQRGETRPMGNGCDIGAYEMVGGPSIPNLTLDPPSPFFFADTQVSSTSVDQDIQLANNGTGSLEITEISKSASPDCDQFNSQFPATPINLGNGEFATMTISFSPTMRGTYSCDINIVSNDPDGNATYTVNGTGIGSSLVLVPPPSVLVFPDTHVGDTSGPIIFTIRNDGELSFTVSSVMIPMGDNDEDYLLGGFLGGVIAPGSTESVEVTFQPQASGDQNATIIINSDADENPTLEIDAIGRGTERLIALSPTVVHFGDVYVGYTRVRAVMITNPGEASLSVTDLSLSGHDASDFTIIEPEVLPTPQMSIEVPGNSSSGVSIECAPATSGSKTASLDVTSDADNAPLISATLNCTALDSSDLIDISGFE